MGPYTRLALDDFVHRGQDRRLSDRMGDDEQPARGLQGVALMPAAGILLHGFGQRYDLPASLALYLFAAGGVVVISFVLIVLFAGDQVGPKAIQYPRRALPFLLPIARSPWPRIVGGTIGVLGLAAIIVTGLFGSNKPELNPTEYLTWIYFWAATVILSGLVGNLWYLLNPWTALHDVVSRLSSPRSGEAGRLTLSRVGSWPPGVRLLPLRLPRAHHGDGQPAVARRQPGPSLLGRDPGRDVFLRTRRVARPLRGLHGRVRYRRQVQPAGSRAR